MIPYLGVSADPVAVADEYTNSKTEERYGEGNINAFAKLCGRDWTYYLQSPQILFGRAPDANSRHGTGAESATHDDSPPIQIDLGPSKVVSRVHAELKFSQSDDRWHVHVYGRNGVRVDEENIRKGHARPIKSGTVITIAGTEMLFQAPSGKSEIHRIFIDRILGHQNNEGLDRELGSAYRQALPDRPLQDMTSIPPSSQHYGYSRPGFNTQTTIARAPLDLARPVTPEPSPPKRAAPGSAKKRSPGYKRGIMMESTEQIDYALDSSRDIKPGCSYAAMITWAIISTPEQALSLSGIYSWIKSHYSYYRVVNSGWQVCDRSLIPRVRR